MEANRLTIPESIFERTIGRKRSPQRTLLIGLVLFLTSFLIGVLDHGLSEFFVSGLWRVFLINPSIIFYILLIAPKLTEVEGKVMQEIIKLGDLSDEVILQIHEDSHAFSQFREWLSIGVGVLIVLFLSAGNLSFDLTSIFLLLIGVIAFGILSWTVYSSVVSVQITGKLLKKPLKVDLFDLEAYKVVGKSSLYLSLSFIGGFSLALLFTAQDLTIIRDIEFWLINLYMFFLPVFIFFWNMYPTHRIIFSAKKDALRRVGQRIGLIKDRMLDESLQSAEIGQLGESLKGLIALESRLEAVQTWPYEVSTLRSLFGSILIPVITVVAQVVLRRLLGW